MVPDDEVSRTHCLIEFRNGSWRVTDRSRHGTFIRGERIIKPVVLEHGDVLEIGSVRLRFSDEADHSAERTASHRVVTRASEQLISRAEEGVLALERPVLVVETGPDEGQRFPLTRTRQFVGAKGSDIPLRDPGLVPRHLGFQVSLGRAMVLPGRGPAFLEGQRIVDLTPVYPGDSIRLGDTTLGMATEVTEQPEIADSFGDMVGTAPLSLQLFGMLRRIARHTAPVLLFGRSELLRKQVAAVLG
jgi:pSer/pThr/pTyr-binding forkhead associated (FHA) protein